jgi:transposase
MSRKRTNVILTEQETDLLRDYAGSGAPNRRIAERAKIILLCAENRTVAEIAQQLGTRPARVSKWRQRFLRYRIFGLSDDQRPGAPASYDDGAERRVLDLLNHPPPEGRERWNGELLSRTLGDVSQWQVWRILRRCGVQLQRQHRWTIPAYADLTVAAIKIAGLYVGGVHNALMLIVGQAREANSTSGFVRLTHKRVVNEFSRMQKTQQVWTLTEALQAAGSLLPSRQAFRCRRSFLAFIEEVSSAQPGLRGCAIVDGSRKPVPEWDRWLKANPQVELRLANSRDAWLDQLEFWFGLLGSGDTVTRKEYARDVREAAARLLINPDLERASPFEWHSGATVPAEESISHRTSAIELVS